VSLASVSKPLRKEHLSFLFSFIIQSLTLTLTSLLIINFTRMHREQLSHPSSLQRAPTIYSIPMRLMMLDEAARADSFKLCGNARTGQSHAQP
jgi:hypothetical protein